jgi:hypothetical protein
LGLLSFLIVQTTNNNYLVALFNMTLLSLTDDDILSQALADISTMSSPSLSALGASGFQSSLGFGSGESTGMMMEGVGFKKQNTESITPLEMGLKTKSIISTDGLKPMMSDGATFGERFKQNTSGFGLE